MSESKDIAGEKELGAMLASYALKIGEQARSGKIVFKLKTKTIHNRNVEWSRVTVV